MLGPFFFSVKNAQAVVSQAFTNNLSYVYENFKKKRKKKKNKFFGINLGGVKLGF
jgi:hypothetical protein